MHLFIILILVVSFLFSLIGITTNYWYQSASNELNEGLWFICRRQSSFYPTLNTKVCQKQGYIKSQGLAISGIILLFVAIIFSTIQRYRKSDRLLAYSTILILTGSTLIIIFSYLLYPREIHLRQLGYSIYLMLISSLLCLITTALITFSTRAIQSTSIIYSA